MENKNPFFEIVKQKIKENNETLLSTYYKNSSTPLTIQCHCGIIYKTNWHLYSIRKKSGCQNCMKKKNIDLLIINEENYMENKEICLKKIKEFINV